MRTRTLLTTPPGEEPVAEDTERHADPERYSPALGLPREPRVPGPRRRLWITLTVLVVVAVAGVVVFRILTAGQFQDPALTEDPSVEQAPADVEADPGSGADAGDVTDDGAGAETEPAG